MGMAFPRAAAVARPKHPSPMSRRLIRAILIPIACVWFVAGPAAHAERLSADIESRIAVLKEGTGRPPMFCMQTLGGNVDQFAGLAKHLNSDAPVYAVLPKSDGAKVYGVTAVAADASRVIAQIQGQGPYVVCGFSSGGALALEVARQLDDSDSLVVMFDSINPAVEGNKGYVQRILDLLGRGWQSLKTKSLAELWDKSYAFVRKTWSYWGHEPEPSGLRVLLFQQQATLDAAEDPTFGWGRVVGSRLQVEIIEGTHGAMLAVPLVADTASRLDRRLADYCDTVPRCTR